MPRRRANKKPKVNHPEIQNEQLGLVSDATGPMASDINPDSRYPNPGIQGRRFRPDLEYPVSYSPEKLEVSRGDLVLLACPYCDPCPCCGEIEPHKNEIVIAFDGGCWNNGKPGALSSIGVYVGDSSQYNLACTLGQHDQHTSQRAELEACRQALLAAIGIRSSWVSTEPNNKLSVVILKSDSEYVVRGVTEWLPKWKKNGFKNSGGLPVANVQQLKAIDNLIEQLEQYIQVAFWLVPRALNQQADNMASYAVLYDGEGADVLRRAGDF
ncbi:hypothetical protein BDW74DRAFT_150129 [Aspergillus multicolor]|uniref:uncharacterized protein n=1 Tax=Aspergillus multicolor TaxID=41759 RepID=UPI003CCE437F